jgi:hypothetical protein
MPTEALTICPLHQNEFVLRWRPRKEWKQPLHNIKLKSVRNVILKIATEIKQIWGNVVKARQGEYCYYI